MVTFLYALGGAVAITCLFAIAWGDALAAARWAEAAWFRLRWGGDPPSKLEAPPEVSTGAVYPAILAWIIAIFLGALALPR